MMKVCIVLPMMIQACVPCLLKMTVPSLPIQEVIRYGPGPHFCLTVAFLSSSVTSALICYVEW